MKSLKEILGAELSENSSFHGLEVIDFEDYLEATFFYGDIFSSKLLITVRDNGYISCQDTELRLESDVAKSKIFLIKLLNKIACIIEDDDLAKNFYLALKQEALNE